MRLELITHDGALLHDHAEPVYWLVRMEFRPAPEGFGTRRLRPGECGLPDRALAGDPYVTIQRSLDTAPAVAAGYPPWDALSSLEIYQGDLGIIRFNSLDPVFDAVGEAISMAGSRRNPEFRLRVERQNCYRRCAGHSLSPSQFYVLEVLP